MSEVAEIAAFIQARLDEDRLWARRASTRNGMHYTDTGEHWRWERTDTDQEVEAKPYAVAYLNEGFAVGLRSVEQYPSSIGVDIPHLVISPEDEVEHAVAGHIVRHDPRRVIREATHKGMMVKILAEEIATEEAHNVLGLMAAAWFDHPDFREEWLW